MIRYRVIAWIMLCGALLAVGSVSGQGGDNLIKNADFEQGLEFWTIQQPCSDCWMEVQGDDAPGRNYLAWERTNAGGSGSAIWAHQALNADVSRYQHLMLTMELRVDRHTLPNSGWWSDENGGSGEYPVKVTLTFADAMGQPIEWSMGFLIVHDGATKLRNFLMVNGNEWTTIETDVFSPEQWLTPGRASLPAPVLLTGITVGGSGWDFRGAVRAITLASTPAPGTGTGGQGDETGQTLTSGLIVEEYPLVSDTEDSPDHFEFRQRVTSTILDTRRTWRDQDPTLAFGLATQAISPWGYALVPSSDHSGAFDLAHDGAVIVAGVDHIWPVTVNSAGTDFRLLVEAAGQTLIVTPDTIGALDTTHFVYIPPVFVGDDLYDVYADWDAGLFHVRCNGQTIYTVIPDGPFVEPPVKSLWSWDGHWVLENEGQVIVDGQSLNEQLGYDEIFGWQFIAGQPFFFFKQNGEIGMSYAGQVVEPYRYTDVIHYLCCEPSMFNVSGNGTMVWFYALRDGIWHYVEAGIYGN